MDSDACIDPYLAGAFAPIRGEDDFDLEMTGEIPAWETLNAERWRLP